MHGRIALLSIVGTCLTILCLYEAFEWITVTEEPQVEDIDKTVEVESVSSSELFWRSLTGGENNYGHIFAILLSFTFFTLPVVVKLFRPLWYRNDDRKQEQKEREIIKEWRKSFAQEIRVTKELMQTVQDRHLSEFRNEMESVKKEIRKNEALYSDFQNLIDVTKTLKFGEDRSALQNARAGNERLSEIERVMKEMRIDVDKLFSMLKEHMFITPAPTKSSVKMRTTTISYTAASKAATEEKRVAKKNMHVSKIPVRIASNRSEIPVRISSNPSVTPRKKNDNNYSRHKLQLR
jgi:hypothetical protein